MDRREARAILESMKLIDFRFTPKSKATEALDLAIEALGDAETATTTHGRLVDADALAEDIRQKCLADNTPMNIAIGKALTVYLLEAPTIVPATPKAEPTTDYISRQAAIEAMAPFDTNHELRDTLDNLPPVTPTERTGEWVSLFDGNEWFIHCSKCKTQHYEEDLLMGGSELPDYCPNCGADMRGAEE